MCAGPTNCTTKTTKQNLLPLFCEMLITSNMHGFVLPTFILKTFTICYWARKGMLPDAHNSQYYGTTLERRENLLLQGWPARRQEARFTSVSSVQDLWGFNTRFSQTIDPLLLKGFWPLGSGCVSVLRLHSGEQLMVHKVYPKFKLVLVLL